MHLLISFDGFFYVICIEPYILGPYEYVCCIRSHTEFLQSVFLGSSSCSSGNGTDGATIAMSGDTTQGILSSLLDIWSVVIIEWWVVVLIARIILMMI